MKLAGQEGGRWSRGVRFYVCVCVQRLRHTPTHKHCCITAGALQAQSVTRLSPSVRIYILDVQIQSCLSSSLDIIYRPRSRLIHTNSSLSLYCSSTNTFFFQLMLLHRLLILPVPGCYKSSLHGAALLVEPLPCSFISVLNHHYI